MNKAILSLVILLSVSTVVQADSGTKIIVDCVTSPTQEKCSLSLDAAEVVGELSLGERVSCKSHPYDLILASGGESGGIDVKLTKEKTTIFGKVKNKTIMGSEIWPRAGVRSTLSLSRIVNGSGMSCTISTK